MYRGLSASPDDAAAIRRSNPGRNPDELKVYTALGEDAYVKLKAAELRRLVVTEPRTVAMRAIQHVWLFWTGTSELGGVLRRLMFFWPVPVAFGGLIVLARQRPLLGAMTALSIAIYSAPYSFSLSMPRYREPIDPILWLLVAVVIDRAYRSFTFTKNDLSSS